MFSSISTPLTPRLMIAVAFATLLVAAGILVVYRNAGDEAQEPSSVTIEEAVVDSTTSTQGGVPEAESLNAEQVAELVQFVEVTRELEFLEPPVVELQAEAEFRSQLAAHIDAELDSEALRESEVIFQALALMAPDEQVEPLLREYLMRRTLGYYEPEAGVVRVVGGHGPLTEAVLVHELTHALESQHFDLDTERFDDRSDESQLAFSSVVEGNAAFVESKYEDQLIEADMSRLVLAQASLEPPPPLSEAVLTALAFPYAEGSVYSRALYSAGGTQMLSDALVRSPRTSEQISEGQIIGQEEVVSEVEVPPVEGEKLASGVLGSLTLRLVLETAIPPGEARELSLQWGGDAFVAWQAESGVCIRTDIVAESEDAHERLFDALVAVAESRPGAVDVSIEQGAIRFTSCGEP